MHPRILLLCMAIFFTGLTGPVTAQQLPPLICGTPDQKPTGLAKVSSLQGSSIAVKGKKKALVLRIGFLDVPYTTDTAQINSVNRSVNDFYRSMSQNTFEWDWRIYDSILIVPGNRAEYKEDDGKIESWIAKELKVRNLSLGIDYDLYVAHFSSISRSWLGRAPKSSEAYINTFYDFRVLSHELGHTLGIPHARSVDVPSDFFPQAEALTMGWLPVKEYGQQYDIMGNQWALGHFNALSKWKLGWLNVNEVQEVSASGVYRFYSHDNTFHKDQPKAIRIRLDSNQAFIVYAWFEYRTKEDFIASGGVSVILEIKIGNTQIGYREMERHLNIAPGSPPIFWELNGILYTGRHLKHKYNQKIVKVLATGPDRSPENGYVDLQVTIPGTDPVSVLKKGSKTLDGLTPSTEFDLAGRKLQRQSRHGKFFTKPISSK